MKEEDTKIVSWKHKFCQFQVYNIGTANLWNMTLSFFPLKRAFFFSNMRAHESRNHEGFH